MKKLIVLLLVTLLWSRGEGKNESSKYTAFPSDSVKKTASSRVAPAPPLPLQITLNGLPAGSAGTSIKAFDQNVFGRIKPKKRISFWFSREVFDNILDLLKKEGAVGGTLPVKDKTDGIRIFLTPDNPSDLADYSIAVVSTLYGGVKHQHKDVFAHQNHPLFSLTGSKHWKKETVVDDTLMRLYTTCTGSDCNVPLCGVARLSEISTSYAFQLVDNFTKNPLNINTRAIWFDYDALRAISALNFDGIRIYLGNYGLKDEAGGAVDNSIEDGYYVKQQRDTFILTTTEKTLSGAQRDFFDCRYKSVTSEAQFKSLIVRIMGGGYNNGELCPNHCN